MDIDDYRMRSGRGGPEHESGKQQALSEVTPVLKSCDVNDETVIREIELLIGQQVGIVSYGPSAENVQVLYSFPS